MKKALITGVSGQDGSYLTEFLIEKGYEVHGTTRIKGERKDSWKLDIPEKLILHEGDIRDCVFFSGLLKSIKPDEIYHLAGQKQSQDIEKDFASFSLNIGVTQCLLRFVKDFSPSCRLFFAASSEMFGNPDTSPQNEETPFHPISPYAISKTTGYFILKMYREAFHIFVCTGILFNHESPRRGQEFVTRKISSAVAGIKKGVIKKLELENLSAQRDWGFAGDYVRAMWLMLQQEKAGDFVIGTGEVHTVGEFAEEAFAVAGLNAENYIVKKGKSERIFDLQALRADITKAKKILKWEPKVSFKKLVHMMVESDLSP